MRSFRILSFVLAAMGAGCAAEVTEPESTDSPLRADALRDSLGRALGQYSAEIVRTNRAAERDLHMLARVEVRPNEILEWYELAPGLVMVSGAGAPVDDAYPQPAAGEDDPEAVWREATSGAAMPRGLRDAIARRGDHSASQRPSKPPTGEEPVADERDFVAQPDDDFQRHIFSGWCDSSYYTSSIGEYGVLGSCDPPSGWGDIHCWDHVTGSGWRSNDDCFQLKSNACPFRGNIRMTISADEDWITRGSYTILENNYRWKSLTDHRCDTDPFDDCPYVKVAIDQADGDGYQYRYWCRDDEQL